MEPGFGLFARHANLKEHLQSAQLVLTGEGRSTNRPHGQRGRPTRRPLPGTQVPCVGLAGVVRDTVQIQRLFAQTHALTPTFTSREKAMRSRPPAWNNWPRAASSWTAVMMPRGRDRESASDRPGSSSRRSKPHLEGTLVCVPAPALQGSQRSLRSNNAHPRPIGCGGPG